MLIIYMYNRIHLQSLVRLKCWSQGTLKIFKVSTVAEIILCCEHLLFCIFVVSLNFPWINSPFNLQHWFPKYQKERQFFHKKC